MALNREQRNRIKREAGFRCGIPTCNTPSPLEIHHIIPSSEDGSDEDSNLICLCRNCHGRVTAGEIDLESVKQYKARLIKINTVLDPHHYRYLEALFQGEHIELGPHDIHLVMKLEREEFVTITELRRPNRYLLQITEKGRRFVE